MHWILGDLDLATMHMVVYDSYRIGTLKTHVDDKLTKLRQGLIVVFRTLGHRTRVQMARSMSFAFASSIPQQAGSQGDCGVWLCHFLSDLVADIRPQTVANPIAEATRWRCHMAEQFYHRRTDVD